MARNIITLVTLNPQSQKMRLPRSRKTSTKIGKRRDIEDPKKTSRKKLC